MFQKKRRRTKRAPFGPRLEGPFCISPTKRSGKTNTGRKCARFLSCSPGRPKMPSGISACRLQHDARPDQPNRTRNCGPGSASHSFGPESVTNRTRGALRGQHAPVAHQSSPNQSRAASVHGSRGSHRICRFNGRLAHFLFHVWCLGQMEEAAETLAQKQGKYPPYYGMSA
jgi:hypothetical protein